MVSIVALYNMYGAIVTGK